MKNATTYITESRFKHKYMILMDLTIIFDKANDIDTLAVGTWLPLD